MVQVYDPKTGTYKEQTAPVSSSFSSDFNPTAQYATDNPRNPNFAPNVVNKSATPIQVPMTTKSSVLSNIQKSGGLDAQKGVMQGGYGLIPKQPTEMGSFIQSQQSNITKPTNNTQTTQASSMYKAPVVPTKENPVIVKEKLTTQVGGVDYSSVDGLDSKGLQRYVDEWQVKASMGEEIPAAERVKLLAASRRLNELTTAANTVDPYQAQIDLQTKARQEEEARLKAQSEALMTAEEKRLAAKYANLTSQAQQSGERTAQAGQKAMSFSGLGRSTFNADQQVQIQQQTENNLAVLNAEKETAIERERMRLQGATSEQLSGYDQRISQLRDKSAQFQLQQAEQLNKFNQDNQATYQEKINNLMSYAQNWTDPNAQLTEQDITTAKAYGQIAIDKDGNINTALLKEIDPRLMGEVIRSAAEARGAIPTNEFGFINVGGGMVAVTDPKTGKVTYEQGQVPKEYSLEKIGDTGYAFDPTTGQATKIAGKLSATGDLRGLASQFPGQAWAKNNNPAGITWNTNFDNPKPGTTAYALQQAGIRYEKGTPRPSSEGGAYVTFPTIEEGLAAQQIMMTQTYGNSTVDQMLRSWVGTGEGPNYAKQVAGMAGVPLNVKVSQLTPDQLSTLQQAKIQKESPGLAKLLSQTPQAGEIKNVQDITLPEKATEFKAKSLTFAQRMQEADKKLTELGLEDTYVNRSSAGQMFQERAPKALKSQDQKALDIYKQSFIAGILRQESGAAISDQEFDRYETQFFPQPGDSKETVASKQALRKQAVRNMYQQVGVDAEGTPIVSIYDSSVNQTPTTQTTTPSTGSLDDLRNNL